MTAQATAEMLGWGDDTLALIAVGNACLPLGACVGAMTGKLSEGYGRRKYLMFNCIVNIFSICINVIPTTPTIIIGRFIQGVSVGIGCSVTPIYNAEFTPIALRSAVGNLFGVQISVGRMLVYAISLPIIWLPVEYVLVVFAIPGIIGAIQLTLFLTVFKHEPYPWYFKHDRPEEGRASIESIY